MRYCSDGFGTIDAANIRRAARIFATRFAHQKYGPKGRYRTLRLCLDRGVRGASFEAMSSYPSDIVQSRFQNATISRCSSCRTLSPRVQ
jgi:hypothetical protein